MGGWQGGWLGSFLSQSCSQLTHEALNIDLDPSATAALVLAHHGPVKGFHSVLVDPRPPWHI